MTRTRSKDPNARRPGLNFTINLLDLALGRQVDKSGRLSVGTKENAVYFCLVVIDIIVHFINSTGVACLHMYLTEEY